MPKITRIGSSKGVILPSKTLEAANLAQGDEVVVAPIQDGVIVAAKNSRSGQIISAMMSSMDDHAEVYRTLASERLSDSSEDKS